MHNMVLGQKFNWKSITGNHVQEAIKKMNPTGIFLYLTKAYAVLNHKVLLSKLNSYGIRSVTNL
jgi:hypothetical protein